MSNTGLKSCPFCGGEASLYNKEDTPFVECAKCKIFTAYYMTSSDAIEQWNTRTVLHNGQPVNLDAILDLAADVGAGPQPFDKAVDWEGTLINYMARLHNKHHALSPTDQAFLAARLEGG